jgi:orotate phosphoribosyltransferase
MQKVKKLTSLFPTFLPAEALHFCLEETMQEQVLELLSGRRGHFLLESGHHGDLWLELENLCLQPRLVQSAATELAATLSGLQADVICAPLIEGAFVGLIVALQLGIPFTYSERFARPTAGGLFPAGYRVPAPLRPHLQGKRVAIVNDVTNAGSAVRGTFDDLEACGASVVAIGSLLVLGSAAGQFAAAKNVPLHSLATFPNNLWTASECPLCASQVPLEDVAAFAANLH